MRRAASAISGVESSAKARDSDSVFMANKRYFLIETRPPPGLLAPTLVTLPSMSRVPRAPFFSFTSDFASLGFAPDNVLVVTTVDQGLDFAGGSVPKKDSFAHLLGRSPLPSRRCRACRSPRSLHSAFDTFAEENFCCFRKGHSKSNEGFESHYLVLRQMTSSLLRRSIKASTLPVAA
jgi:hypothetical protein